MGAPGSGARPVEPDRVIVSLRVLEIARGMAYGLTDSRNATAASGLARPIAVEVSWAFV